jgi:hypothetical protein
MLLICSVHSSHKPEEKAVGMLKYQSIRSAKGIGIYIENKLLYKRHGNKKSH